MSEDIPCGYQLHITSWENDADSYMTEIISGLSEDDTQFLLSIGQQFKTRSLNTGGLGNQGNSHLVLVKLIVTALESHPHISDDMRAHWTLELPIDDLDDLTDDELESAGSQAHELLCELLGSPVSEYYQEELNFCRVFSSFKVYWFAAPAIDVSSKFSNV